MLTTATSRMTMNWARQTTNSRAVGEDGRRVLSEEIAFTGTLCDNSNPGTREVVILVVDMPPNTFNGDAGPSVRSNRPQVGNGDRRRAELADFLRTKRASIKPEDVGLRGSGRRRTPGLRREEVAQLAGVGTTWYTWLEQGRDVRASLDVFEALARALRCTPV